MPKNSPSDDISQQPFGELFQEMGVSMNAKHTTQGQDKMKNDINQDENGYDLSNMYECPTPRFYSLTPLKQGFLIKQGHNFRNWKKRLCALEGSFLYYYAEEDDMSPRGVIFIENCIVREEPLVGKEKKTSCFSIQASKAWNVSNNRCFHDRKFYFCSASQNDFSDWIALLSRLSTGLPKFMQDSLF